MIDIMDSKLIVVFVLLGVLGMAVFVSAQTHWSTEYQTSVYEGWNLIYGFYTPEQIQGLDQSNIKAIWGFVPTSQEYIQVYPEKYDDLSLELRVNHDFDDEDLIMSAFWVYSDSETGEDFNGIPNGVEYWLDHVPPFYAERPLWKGWNFVGITPDMIPGPQDTDLKDIKGNCNIEKSYFFNAGAQKWNEAPIEYAQLEEYSIGSGWVIKVSNNCNLGASSEGNTVAPPTIPS